MNNKLNFGQNSPCNIMSKCLKQQGRCTCPLVDINVVEDIFSVDRKDHKVFQEYKAPPTVRNQIIVKESSPLSPTELERMVESSTLSSRCLSPTKITSSYLAAIRCNHLDENEIEGLLTALEDLSVSEKQIVFELVRRVRFGCQFDYQAYSLSKMRTLIMDGSVYTKRTLDLRKYIIGEFHKHILDKNDCNLEGNIDHRDFYRRKLTIKKYFKQYISKKGEACLPTLMQKVFRWDFKTRQKSSNYTKRWFASICYLDCMIRVNKDFTQDLYNFSKDILLKNLRSKYDNLILQSISRLVESYNLNCQERTEDQNNLFFEIAKKVRGSKRFKFPWHPRLYEIACEHMVEFIDERTEGIMEMNRLK